MNKEIKDELSSICYGLIAEAETINDAAITSYLEADEFAKIAIGDDYGNQHELCLLKMNGSWVIWNTEAEYTLPLADINRWLIHNLASKLTKASRALYELQG